MVMRLNFTSYLLKGLMLVFVSSFFFSLRAQQFTLLNAQGKVYKDFDNRINALVVINGNTASTELRVQPEHNGLTVEWYEYYNHTASPQLHVNPQFLSNQQFIYPEDHCGYLVTMTGNVNGQPYSKTATVFVVDYSLYIPSAIDLIIADDAGCELLMIDVPGGLPDMQYVTTVGLAYTIERELNLSYESLEWRDGKWVDLSISTDLYLTNNQILIANPPLKDTRFTLKGDQFASELGMPLYSYSTELYMAKKVACVITTSATVRDELHENDRPQMASAISGSAPLEIRFKANGNEPVANYYNWTIHAEDRQLLARTDETHSFTFTEAGTFLVRLRAENSFCSSTDSITIKVSESAIDAPNVFTPNGDGINDEFRVAYKSIVEFQAIIYNRWGTKMYEWTDIQKGWDGTKNGRPVPEGPYFYVIRARGSDGLVYNLKGDINLLRGKRY
jgi:gliding motility-associated-like protein